MGSESENEHRFVDGGSHGTTFCRKSLFSSLRGRPLDLNKSVLKAEIPVFP